MFSSCSFSKKDVCTWVFSKKEKKCSHLRSGPDDAQGCYLSCQIQCHTAEHSEGTSYSCPQAGLSSPGNGSGLSKGTGQHPSNNIPSFPGSIWFPLFPSGIFHLLPKCLHLLYPVGSSGYSSNRERSSGSLRAWRVTDYNGFKRQTGPRYAVPKAHNLPAIKILPKQISMSSLENLSHNCLRGVAKKGTLKKDSGCNCCRWTHADGRAGKGLFRLTLSYPGLTQSQMLSSLVDI